MTEADAIPADFLDKPDPPTDNDAVAVAGRQRETHMGFVRSLATILFIIALPVAIVTTNVRLLLNASLIYDYSFDRYNAEETTGLARADLDRCGAELRAYFNNGEPTYYCTVTENGLTVPIFSARETQHMEDVKSLVVWLNRVQLLSVMYIVAYGIVFFVWSAEGSARQLAGQSLIGLLLGAVAVGTVGVFAAFGFDAAWERFHKLLFTNDLWRLNPRTDHLIQMFPEEFWRDATFILGAMCLLEAAVIAAVAGIYLLSSRTQHRQLAGSIDVTASSTQAA
jgi:integral membrane protein (TIGR01906 family)